MIAAERTGRRAYAMEIEPVYVEIAIRRWEDYTGEHAIHAEAGRTFAEMQKIRSQEPAADLGDPNINGSPVEPLEREACHVG